MSLCSMRWITWRAKHFIPFYSSSLSWLVLYYVYKYGSKLDTIFFLFISDLLFGSYNYLPSSSDLRTWGLSDVRLHNWMPCFLVFAISNLSFHFISILLSVSILCNARTHFLTQISLLHYLNMPYMQNTESQRIRVEPSETSPFSWFSTLIEMP